VHGFTAENEFVLPPEKTILAHTKCAFSYHS